MAGTGGLVTILGRAALRPGLLAALLGAAWRFRARAWWRRPPFLPVPPRDYLDWRMHTAYGDEGRLPSAGELERYIRWANRMHRTRRRGVRLR